MECLLYLLTIINMKNSFPTFVSTSISMNYFVLQRVNLAQIRTLFDPPLFIRFHFVNKLGNNCEGARFSELNEINQWFSGCHNATMPLLELVQYIWRVATHDSNLPMETQSITLIRFNFWIKSLINLIQIREYHAT